MTSRLPMPDARLWDLSGSSISGTAFRSWVLCAANIVSVEPAWGMLNPAQSALSYWSMATRDSISVRAANNRHLLLVLRPCASRSFGARVDHSSLRLLVHRRTCVTRRQSGDTRSRGVSGGNGPPSSSSRPVRLELRRE